jgi:hypothetical protein
MDAFLVDHPLRIPGGWEWKCHAIMHSGFARVLYIDVDAYPVTDPAWLFGLLDSDPFVFWEDLPACTNNIHWEAFGVKRPGTGITFQGGVGLFDVAACWKMLTVYAWLNWHSDWSYSHGFGDQDMCLIATVATGLQYRSLGAAQWCVVAFTYAHDGTKLFVHRCRSKFIVGTLPQYSGRLPGEEAAFDLWSCIDEGYWERVIADRNKKALVDPRQVRRRALERQR